MLFQSKKSKKEFEKVYKLIALLTGKNNAFENKLKKVDEAMVNISSQVKDISENISKLSKDKNTETEKLMEDTNKTLSLLQENIKDINIKIKDMDRVLMETTKETDKPYTTEDLYLEMTLGKPIEQIRAEEKKRMTAEGSSD